MDTPRDIETADITSYRALSIGDAVQNYWRLKAIDSIEALLLDDDNIINA